MTNLQHFSISGSHFTDNAKNLVLDGKWNQALRMLIESFDGMTYDIAYKILQGKLEIQVNENGVNVLEVEDKTYQEEIFDIYCFDKFFENNQLYTFSHFINSEMVHKDIQERHLTYNIPDFDTYVRKYLIPKDMFGFNVSKGKECLFVIAEKTNENEIPVWLDKFSILNSAKNYAINNWFSLKEKNNIIKETSESLNLSSYDSEFNSKFKNAQAIEQALKAGFKDVESYSDFLRKSVINQLENVTYNKFQSTYGEVTYPKELAISYAFYRTSKKHLNTWKTTLKSGLKMENDSPLHTELWLLLGFNLNGNEYIQNSKENLIFNELIDYIQKSHYENSEFTTLNSANLSNFKGFVVDYKSENITKNDIIVIPSASVEFEVPALKAGLIICENGGKLAHLCIVGREFGIPLIRIDNATKLFQHGSEINIDFENQTLTHK